MKLSANFTLDEFTTSAGILIKPTDQQIFCLNTLANNILQPIRYKFGKVNITSGLRNQESYNRLVSQGYPASKTSDHFGWSHINPKGTGAADIYCPEADSMIVVFHWIIRTLYHKCRQIIYYPGMNIIHISNNFNHIFHMPDTISTERRIMVKKPNEKFQPYTFNWLCGGGDHNQ